jgi:hypothetical protein
MLKKKQRLYKQARKTNKWTNYRTFQKECKRHLRKAEWDYVSTNIIDGLNNNSLVLQYPKNIVVWFLVLALGVLRILLVFGLVNCLALMLLMDLYLLIVFLGPFDQ